MKKRLLDAMTDKAILRDKIYYDVLYVFRGAIDWLWVMERMLKKVPKTRKSSRRAVPKKPERKILGYN